MPHSVVGSVCLLIVSQFVLFYVLTLLFYMYVLFTYLATISINALTYLLTYLHTKSCKNHTLNAWGTSTIGLNTNQPNPGTSFELLTAKIGLRTLLLRSYSCK